MTSSTLLKASSILWIIWGLVHVFAGIMTMKGILTNDITASVSGIADAVNPESLKVAYPKAAGAVIGHMDSTCFGLELQHSSQLFLSGREIETQFFWQQ